MDNSKRKRWTLADMHEGRWKIENENAMRMFSTFSDESAQAMFELQRFVQNAVQAAMTQGTTIGLCLGILRLSAYGYRIRTEGHWDESRIVMFPPKSSGRLSSVLQGKLNRWGWDGHPRGSNDRVGTWVYELRKTYIDV